MKQWIWTTSRAFLDRKWSNEYEPLVELSLVEKGAMNMNH